MAQKKAPHRHHYIPQMILRNFLDANGGIWFWRRNPNFGEARVTTTENLFAQDNLYTLVGDDGERDVSLEQAFAKLESVGVRLIVKLLGLVRSGVTPRLNDEAWEFFHYFYYLSGKRSPAWHQRFVSEDEVVAVTKMLAKERNLEEASIALPSDPKERDRVLKNARIAAQSMGPPGDILTIMRDRGMAIYVAPPGSSFILGDHPTASAKIEHEALQQGAGRVAFMPISFDVAVGYIRQRRMVRVMHLTRPQLQVMNEAMARQSEMIAGRSQELVSSLSTVGYESPEHFSTSHYLEE